MVENGSKEKGNRKPRGIMGTKRRQKKTKKTRIEERLKAKWRREQSKREKS